MNANILNQPPADSLDYQQQRYSRVQSGHSRSPITNQTNQAEQLRHEQMVKNMYKQQLDDLIKHKNQIKTIEKEKQIRERKQYNDRMQYGKEAERLKELSYKNYYNMLMSNQSALSENYINPFQYGQSKKDQLININIEQDRKRSQQWYQQQQKRAQQMKRNYKEQLVGQLQMKQYKNAVQNEIRHKNHEQVKKVLHSPQQLAKYERQRKLLEMQRYKQDLDRTKQQNQPNARFDNDFNLHKIQDRHDLLVNPLPFNIQNPYILRQLKKSTIER